MVTDKLQEFVDVEDSNLFTKDKSAMATTLESKHSARQPTRRGRALQHTSSRKTSRRMIRISAPPSLLCLTKGPLLPTRRSPHREKKKLAAHEVNPTKCKWCKKWGGNGLVHGPPNNIPHAKYTYNGDMDG